MLADEFWAKYKAECEAEDAAKAERAKRNRLYFEHYYPPITPDRLGWSQRLCPDEDEYCRVPTPDPSGLGICTLRRGAHSAHVGHIKDGSALFAWDVSCEPGTFAVKVGETNGEVRLPLGERAQYDAVSEWDLIPDADGQLFAKWEK